MLQDYKYIYFQDTNNKYSNDNRNNLVIFREKNKTYKLGKLKIQKMKIKIFIQNNMVDIYTILYFDRNEEDNYSDALKKMKVYYK